jgi:hypothetical protein
LRWHLRTQSFLLQQKHELGHAEAGLSCWDQKVTVRSNHQNWHGYSGRFFDLSADANPALSTMAAGKAKRDS